MSIYAQKKLWQEVRRELIRTYGKATVDKRADIPCIRNEPLLATNTPPWLKLGKLKKSSTSKNWADFAKLKNPATSEVGLFQASLNARFALAGVLGSSDDNLLWGVQHLPSAAPRPLGQRPEAARTILRDRWDEISAIGNTTINVWMLELYDAGISVGYLEEGADEMYYLENQESEAEAEVDVGDGESQAANGEQRDLLGGMNVDVTQAFQTGQRRDIDGIPEQKQASRPAASLSAASTAAATNEEMKGDDSDDDGDGDEDDDDDDDPEAEATFDPEATQQWDFDADDEDDGGSDDVAEGENKEINGKDEKVGVHIDMARRPAHNLATLKADVGQPTSGGGSGAAAASPRFYLASVAYRSVAPAENRAFLPDPVGFNRFLACLPRGFLVVNRSPGDPLGTAQSVSISKTDYWAELVRGNGLGISDLACKLVVTRDAATNRQSAEVSELTATVKLDNNHTLTYTTATGPAMLGIEIKDDVLFINQYRLLVLGLSSGITSISLPDIIDLLGPSWLKQMALLVRDDISSKINFTLTNDVNSRNGLFLCPDSMSTTYHRLQFKLVDDTTSQKAIDWLKGRGLVPLSNLKVSGLTFTCVRKFTGETISDLKTKKRKIIGSKKTSFNFSGQIQFTQGSDPITFWIVFESNGVKMIIRFADAELTADAVLRWLKDSLGLDADDTRMSEDQVKSLVPANTIGVKVHQVEIDVSKPPGRKGKAKRKTKTSVTCKLVLQLNIFGTIFFTTFTFPGLKIRAELWSRVPSEVKTYRWVPWYEPYQEYSPFPSDEQSGPGRTVDFTRIAADSGNDPPPPPPDSGFFTLEQAVVEISKTKYETRALLTAIAFLRAPTGDIPMIWPEYFKFRASAEKTGATGHSKTNWLVGLEATLILPPVPWSTAASDAVRLNMSVTKTNDSWTIAGHAEELDFGALYGYFEPNAKDSVMDILEGIGVPYFDVVYTHGKTTRDLLVSGAFEIKDFELLFRYHYKNTVPNPAASSSVGDSSTGKPAPGSSQGSSSTTPPSKPSWTFTASLGPTSATGDGTLTLVDVISEFFPSGDDSGVIKILNEIPLLTDLKVKTVAPGQTDNPIMFGISKVEDTGALVMYFKVEILLGDGPTISA